MTPSNEYLTICVVAVLAFLSLLSVQDCERHDNRMRYQEQCVEHHSPADCDRPNMRFEFSSKPADGGDQ